MSDCPFRHDCIRYPHEGRAVVRLFGPMASVVARRMLVVVPVDHRSVWRRYLRDAEHRAAAHGLVLIPTGDIERHGDEDRHVVIVRPCATVVERERVYRLIAEGLEIVTTVAALGGGIE